MNICFLSGKIISDIKFDFCIKNSNSFALASCYIVCEESKIRIRAYDENASELYSKFEKASYIEFEGSLRNDYIDVRKIYF